MHAIQGIAVSGADFCSYLAALHIGFYENEFHKTDNFADFG
ncbi:hypothetical protein OE766_17790 [Pararhizobium sp. YC-54]|nr:hypothetical protein [Pararhizobium sp. YC-54]MCW0000094.1 hypothetical protein [Pararhizobium sp. YC-54]